MTPTPRPGHWFAVAALAVTLLLPATAAAHTDHELDQWQAEWLGRAVKVAEEPALLAPLMAEWWDMAHRHPCQMLGDCPQIAPRSHRTPSAVPYGVEQWASLTEQFFGSLTPTALCLMGHESGGDPNARNRSSGASGLLQVMPWWADHFGISRASLFDPATNLRIARQIYEIQGWGAWSPYNRGLCH